MSRYRIGAIALVALGAGCTIIVDGRIADNDRTVDCAMEEDGVSCGQASICLDAACAPSRCGDGFIDLAGGEDCEDGNQVSGDGCEPGGCRFTCTEDANCDDGDPCNGAETCDTVVHLCGAGTPPVNGTVECARAGGVMGMCVSGLCAPEGCGDGVVDGDEECDEISAGCRSDCTWECQIDDNCSDGSVCTGTETCDVSTHTCEAGAALDCDDAEVCTLDTCDGATGCAYSLIDNDMDGVSALTCDNEGATLHGILIHGDDCDDDDAQRSPLLSEQCDAIDHDCDGNPMNDVVDQTYYRDADNDGFANPLDSMVACQAPPGYIVARADNQWDCADLQPERRPRPSSEWFERPTCTVSGVPSWSCAFGPCAWRCPAVTGQTNSTTLDWNCDGNETERYPLEYSTECVRVGTTSTCVGEAWTGAKPAHGCGFSGEYRTCAFVPHWGVCWSTLVDRMQQCQ